jgi:hypothetical protein
VTFAIYQQQEGGAPLWLETQNVTTDAGGRYSILLGNTSASGLPNDLFSPREQRWLGVQVQGQTEQARVLLVSVPYAMKAAEADTLAGHSVSEFVTTDTLHTAVQQQLQQQGSANTAITVGSSGGVNGSEKFATTNPATNFVDSTTDQVVKVTQNGTGIGLSAASPGNVGVLGTSNAKAIANIVAGVEAVSSLPNSFGLYARVTNTSTTQPSFGVAGIADGPIGIGLEGIATGNGSTIGLLGRVSSNSGIAIDATNTATAGVPVGLLARVSAPGATGALIVNVYKGTPTGPLINAMANNASQFVVGGNGNVTATGTLSGTQLISTVATGTAPLQVTSTTQVPNLNASLLGGNSASGFIQNGTSTQLSTNFNISGNGILGGFLSAANAAPGGSAVIGNDTATSGSSSGVSGTTSNPNGSGVVGNATSTTSNGSGVLGLANSANAVGVQGVNSADGGIGMYAHASSNNGTQGTWGILGQSDSPVAGSTGVRGRATASTGVVHGVHGTTNSATDSAAGVAGNSTSTTGQTFGVFGLANSTANYSAGVNGFHRAVTGVVFGVAGSTNSVTNGSAAVNGYQGAATGQVYGVSGSTNSTTNYAAGVSGYEGASSGAVFGVNGGTNSSSDGATGVNGSANASSGATNGVQGNTNSTSDNASGVSGHANGATGRTYGVNGSTNSSTTNSAGVTGFASASTGMVIGVSGGTNSTTNGAAAVNGYEGASTGAVFGVNGATNSTTDGAAAVNGFEGATSGAVYGVNGGTNSTTDGAAAINAFEGATSGRVYGMTASTNSTTDNAAAVSAYEGATSGKVFGLGAGTQSSSNGAAGVSGAETATTGEVFGVIGGTLSNQGVGVAGSAGSATGATFGVQGSGISPQGVGVEGWSPNVGVAGVSQVCNPNCSIVAGIAGQFITGAGGTVLQGIGNGSTVFTVDAGGNGNFAGNLHVSGTLSKGGGSFKIDHPLDPENKTLSHSFVESPDMMNVYNGNITTDAHGWATVVLPEYFDALNRDFRYQLTVIGQFAQAIVAKEIRNNRFTIRSSRPGVKVSWQVTGIRQDAWANANRIPVEEIKPDKERGTYLYPDLYGDVRDQLASARH